MTTGSDSALARLETAPARPRGSASRFFGAMVYPFRAIGFVIDHPRLLPLALAPIATTIVALVLLLGGAWHLASSLAHRWADGHGLFGAVLFVLIMLCVVVALGYVGFVVLLSLACAPFCSALSDRVEAYATGRPIPKRALGATLYEAVRGIGHALARLAIYVAISVPLYLLGVVVPPASPVFVGVGMLVTSYFLAYDFFDYPLSSREKGFGEKWRYVMDHQAESLGFGAMVGLLLAIPALNVLVAPFAAVGAALLFVDLERAHATN